MVGEAVRWWREAGGGLWRLAGRESGECEVLYVTAVMVVMAGTWQYCGECYVFSLELYTNKMISCMYL